MAWGNKRKKAPKKQKAAQEKSTKSPSNSSSEDAPPRRKRRMQSLHHHCYLLRSLDLSHPNSTYIGYTVNPHNRIRQHNGEKKGGAYRTRRCRPWTFAVVVHGFESANTGTSFEWHWQHPYKSTHVRNAIGDIQANRFKRQYNVRAKLAILKTLVTECEELTKRVPLTLYFFEDKWKNVFESIKMESGAPLPDSVSCKVIDNFEEMIFWDDRRKRKARKSAAALIAQEETPKQCCLVCWQQIQVGADENRVIKCSQCENLMHSDCPELHDIEACPKCSYDINLSIANARFGEVRQQGSAEDSDVGSVAESVDDENCMFCSKTVVGNKSNLLLCSHCSAPAHESCTKENDVEGDGLCPNCEQIMLSSSKSEFSADCWRSESDSEPEMLDIRLQEKEMLADRLPNTSDWTGCCSDTDSDVDVGIIAKRSMSANKLLNVVSWSTGSGSSSSEVELLPTRRRDGEAVKPTKLRNGGIAEDYAKAIMKEKDGSTKQKGVWDSSDSESGDDMIDERSNANGKQQRDIISAETTEQMKRLNLGVESGREEEVDRSDSSYDSEDLFKENFRQERNKKKGSPKFDDTKNPRLHFVGSPGKKRDEVIDLCSP